MDWDTDYQMDEFLATAWEIEIVPEERRNPKTRLNETKYSDRYDPATCGKMGNFDHTSLREIHLTRSRSMYCVYSKADVQSELAPWRALSFEVFSSKMSKVPGA